MNITALNTRAREVLGDRAEVVRTRRHGLVVLGVLGAVLFKGSVFEVIVWLDDVESRIGR